MPRWDDGRGGRDPRPPRPKGHPPSRRNVSAYIGTNRLRVKSQAQDRTGRVPMKRPANSAPNRSIGLRPPTRLMMGWLTHRKDWHSGSDPRRGCAAWGVSPATRRCSCRFAARRVLASPRRSNPHSLRRWKIHFPVHPSAHTICSLIARTRRSHSSLAHRSRLLLRFEGRLRRKKCDG